jgi:hypothetical protein
MTEQEKIKLKSFNILKNGVIHKHNRNCFKKNYSTNILLSRVLSVTNNNKDNNTNTISGTNATKPTSPSIFSISDTEINLTHTHSHIHNNHTPSHNHNHIHSHSLSYSHISLQTTPIPIPISLYPQLKYYPNTTKYNNLLNKNKRIIAKKIDAK